MGQVQSTAALAHDALIGQTVVIGTVASAAHGTTFVLDVKGGASPHGAPLLWYAFHGGPNQRFTVVREPGNLLSLAPVNLPHMRVAAHPSTGSAVALAPAGTPHARWSASPSPYGGWELSPAAAPGWRLTFSPDAAFSDDEDDDSHGGPATVAPLAGHNTQAFHIHRLDASTLQRTGKLSHESAAWV